MLPKMARGWCFVLLSLLAVAVAADNPNSSEGDADTHVVIKDTEASFVLTEDICMNGHRSAYMSDHCCQMYTDHDNITEHCASKVPSVPPKTKTEKIVQLSKLSECIFKKRKYIKDDHTLNIGHVKADAAKLDDTLAEKYMVNMYRSCSREAKQNLNKVTEAAKLSAEHRTYLQMMHKPYFVFVYSCSLFYSAKHQCPYFRWFSLEDDRKCEEYARQCKTLVKK